jgi:hypothetical protein
MATKKAKKLNKGKKMEQKKNLEIVISKLH